MKGKILTDKQKCFCQEYRMDFNGTAAAIRAGFSKKTAGSQGQRMLKNVEIQRCLGAMQNDAAIRNRLSVDYLVDEFKSIATDDIANYLNFRTNNSTVMICLKKNLAGASAGVLC